MKRKPTHEKYVTLNVKIPPHMAKKLREKSRRERYSQGELVRQALAPLLDEGPRGRKRNLEEVSETSVSGQTEPANEPSQAAQGRKTRSMRRGGRRSLSMVRERPRANVAQSVEQRFRKRVLPVIPAPPKQEKAA